MKKKKNKKEVNYKYVYVVDWFGKRRRVAMPKHFTEEEKKPFELKEIDTTIVFK